MGSRRKGASRKKYGDNGFEQWGGYMSAKISKLENQFENEAGSQRRGIFYGISIFVNGYTEPPADELKRIMITNGGTFHHYYSRSGTMYIIASNLPNSKIQSLKNNNIVSPKWITESLKAGKLLDHKKYLLYPNVRKSQPTLGFGQPQEENNSTECLSNAVSCKMDTVTVKDEDVDDSRPSDSDHGNRESDILIVTSEIEKSANTLINSDSKADYTDITSHKSLVTKSHDSNNSSLQLENRLEVVPSAPRVSTASSSLNVNANKIFLSTANPNFLSDFYSNSRLHHISTSGAMFKQYVRDLQTKENFIGRMHLCEWMKQKGIEPTTQSFSNKTRIIMHIDMDSFFVSVGIRKHPELVNQPVAVTHASRNSTPRRDEVSFSKEVKLFRKKYGEDSNSDEGEQRAMPSSVEDKRPSSKASLIDAKCSFAEIASCSYEARQRGVKNGMYLGIALKLCPELKTIPYDFEGYQAVSVDLYDIVASYTKNIEAVSCDEMYVELGDVLAECGASPLQFASCIREQIQEKTKCPCSVGIGPNMITARMATKKAKPNGQLFLESSQVLDFMRPLQVSELPGVGGSLEQRLADEGVKTCQDLQGFSLQRLQGSFGDRTGVSLYNFCRGIDDRQVNKEHQRKSVSAEVNYGIRFENWNDADKFVSELSEEVTTRLANVSMKGRTITLKLKIRSKDAPVETAKFMGHGICDNTAKSVTLPNAIREKQAIYREVSSLLRQLHPHPKDMRGVGIQISKLEPASSATSIKTFFSKMKNTPPSRSSTTKATKESGPSPVPMEINDEDVNSNDASDINERKPVVSNLTGRKVEEKKPVGGRRTLDSWAKVNKKPRAKEKWDSSDDTGQDIKTSTKDPLKALDVEVFNALPPEMREQVLEEYKARGYFVPSQQQQHSDSSPQPGPSTLCIVNPEPLLEEMISHDPVLSSEEDEVVVLAQNDLSFSQIDQSFLNALPMDVMHDLRRDLRYSKNKLESSTNGPKISSLPSLVSKRKRGRPRGSVNKTPSWKSPSKAKSPIRPSKTHSTTTTDARNALLQSPKKEVTHENSDSKDERSGASQEASSDPPNLCGQYQWDGVKTLITEWILTCQTPADIDVQILSDFCQKLIEAHDLEKLELVLKTLNRKTNAASQEWQESFESILFHVQTLMREKFKAPLHYTPLTRPA